ncbi:MAG: ankyrin repeat domain-containing protein [Parachlamydiaceae bacterium]|nr:MAG: ankyrin repeat domain-containing protein [Parachlamydiaceae bacterium]
MNLIKYLIQNGADINAAKETSSGQVFTRAFDFAVYYGNLEMFSAFMEAGVDINAKTYQGRTPVFYALGADAQFGRLEERFKIDEKTKRKMINDLLAKNCELNIADDYGSSPLMYAIAAEDLESVSSMIENGADVNFKASLSLATKTNNPDLMDLLFEKGAVIDPENYSSIAFNLSLHFSIPILEKLLAQGFPIDTPNQDLQTLLHLSVMKNEYDFAKILLERGARLEQQDVNGKSP